MPALRSVPVPSPRSLYGRPLDHRDIVFEESFEVTSSMTGGSPAPSHDQDLNLDVGRGDCTEPAD